MSVKQKKKKKVKPVSALLLVAALALLVLILAARLFNAEPEQNEPTPERVQIFDGSDYVWITPEKNVPVSSLTVGDFGTDADGRPVYTGDEYKTQYGIDVSDYQGDIDWQTVYDSGVRFAILRAGGRYYGDGGLYTDSRFKENLAEAQAAGLKVGVYFFSQAVNEDEAIEEAKLTLGQIGDASLELPVFFDWETISGDTARTDGVDGGTVTDCAVAFCETVKKAGFDAGVYLYSYTGYHCCELRRLTDYTLWFSAPGNSPNFYYRFDIWQYSFEGSVPGVPEKCDLNMMFILK